MDNQGRVRRGCNWRLVNFSAFRLLLAASVAFISSAGMSDCLSLVKGDIAYDVTSCRTLEPELLFDLEKEKYRWVKELDRGGRERLYNQYRGLLLRGKVVKSQAVEKGLAKQRGVLRGETVYTFVPPGQSTCQALNKRRVIGTIDEKCCDGGGDAPCLLPTTYRLLNPRKIGSAGSDAGDATRKRASLSADYKKASQYMKKRKFKLAAKYYERAVIDQAIDIKGLYNLGLAYRKLDLCKKAISPLSQVFDLQTKGRVWADEETIARKAVFLLARCYSKNSDAQAAVVVLGSYILEPKKYKTEIKESMRHKDFGWIKSAKEYREYIKDAQKALREANRL